MHDNHLASSFSIREWFLRSRKWRTEKYSTLMSLHQSLFVGTNVTSQLSWHCTDSYTMNYKALQSKNINSLLSMRPNIQKNATKMVIGRFWYKSQSRTNWCARNYVVDRHVSHSQVKLSTSHQMLSPQTINYKLQLLTTRNTTAEQFLLHLNLATKKSENIAHCNFQHFKILYQMFIQW